MNTDYDTFENGVSAAPEGTYEQSRQVVALIGRTADRLIHELKIIGLRADNCDLIREVEVAIYRYVVASNPDWTERHTTEGLGAYKLQEPT